MSDQIDPLVIAQEFEVAWSDVKPCVQAALVLRRQHAQIEADEALMRQALNFVEDVFDGEWPGFHDRAVIAAALRARLETSNAS